MWAHFGLLGFLIFFHAVNSQNQFFEDEPSETIKTPVGNTSSSVPSEHPQLPALPGPALGPTPPRGRFGSRPSNDNGVPPGFESVLPADVIQQLKNLHDNQTLLIPEKREEFDRIMNSVPGELLAKLPFPPGFDTLPREIRDKIEAIHTNAQLTWNDKSKQIGQLIESLPPNLKQLLPGAPPPVFLKQNFPQRPPPGFEKVLPKEVYEKLLVIHQDPSISSKEKIQKIDAIIRSLDQQILDALPLPPGFDQLPAETVKKAKAIFSDKTLDYESKNKKVIQFVKSLPAEQRLLVKPPMPPVLNQLPKEVKDQIDAIFDNENLGEEQRHDAFWKLVDTLPAQQKVSIRRELGDGKAGSFDTPFGYDEDAAAVGASNPESPSST